MMPSADNSTPLTLTQLRLINALAFQACWFACVIGGNLWGAITVGLFFAWHQRVSSRFEWLLIVVIAGAGSALDTLWYQLGLIGFPDYELVVIPVWLFLLWLAFAATLLHSLDYLFSRPIFIALASAIAAPISYYAGHRLGALETDTQGLLTIALSWAVLMGVAALISQRLSGRLKPAN
ncbi:MAG: DUF2878 domain-containing protein [Thalassolituus sp.]